MYPQSLWIFFSNEQKMPGSSCAVRLFFTILKLNAPSYKLANNLATTVYYVQIFHACCSRA
jgi:hypothetical protein